MSVGHLDINLALNNQQKLIKIVQNAISVNSN